MNDMLLRDVVTKYGHVTVLGPKDNVENWSRSIAKLNYEGYFNEHLHKLDFTTFVDIGAAFGYFSHYWSNNGKECIAVEPELFRYACMSQTTGVFKRLHASIGNTPVGKAKAGCQAHVRLPEKLSNLPRYSIRQIIALTEAQKEEDVLVKLDIEGAEFALFDEDHDWIKKAKCKWLIEIHPKWGKTQDILSLFPNRTILQPLEERPNYLIT